MSKQFELNQTSIPSQYSINCKEKYFFGWVDTRTEDLYRTLFTSIATALKDTQKEKKMNRVGFNMLDAKGIFKLGAILSFHKPDVAEEEDSGNWFLEFTLYEEDMTDLDKELDNHSGSFVAVAANIAYTIAHARFGSTEYMYSLFDEAINTLVDFLDTNASEDDEVEVYIKGVFTASVAVENGKKVMSIVPGEAIKQIIKSDSIL